MGGGEVKCLRCKVEDTRCYDDVNFQPLCDRCDEQLEFTPDGKVYYLLQEARRFAELVCKYYGHSPYPPVGIMNWMVECPPSIPWEVEK